MKVYNAIYLDTKCSNRYLNYDKSTNGIELGSQYQTERHQTKFTLDELTEIEDEHGLMIIGGKKWQLEEGGNHD